MSNLYAISSYEDWFGGLHGVRTDFVAECSNYDEAQELAVDESVELIYSFNIMADAGWEDEAKQECLEPGTDEFEEYINECIGCDICYEIHIITEAGSKSVEDLQEELDSLGYDDFIAKYCKGNDD